MVLQARQQVEKQFNIVVTTQELLKLIKQVLVNKLETKGSFKKNAPLPKAAFIKFIGAS